jgi:hypothetical protein
VIRLATVDFRKFVNPPMASFADEKIRFCDNDSITKPRRQNMTGENSCPFLSLKDQAEKTSISK